VSPDRLRIAIRVGIYALLLFAPLPFGSVQSGYVLAIELTAAAIGLASIALLAIDAEARAALPRLPLALCGGIVALGVFQILPLPFSVAERFNPTADLVRPLIPYLGLDHPPAVSWSVAPPETTDALLRFIAYVWIGLGAALAFDSSETRKRFAIVLVASAVFQAVYGSGEYLTGRQHILGYAKKHYLDSATGTFINRNHFATFLAMALPFALSLAIPEATDPPRAGWRERILSSADPESVVRLFGFAGAMLIWLGLLLSHSRTGLVASLVAAAIVLARHRRARTARWIAAAAALVLLALLSRELAQSPGERFLSHRRDLEVKGGRLTVWGDALALVKNRPILGSGFGTFENAFPGVQSAEIRLGYNHAHNDWLEWLLEGGILGLAAAIGLLVAALRGRHVVAKAALVAVALHAAWDFSLRIPSVAAAAAILLGVAVSRYVDATSSRAALIPFPPPSTNVSNHISRLIRFQIRWALSEWPRRSSSMIRRTADTL
jgi:O-antigen ligase